MFPGSKSWQRCRWQCCRSCHAALGCAGRAGVSSQRHHPNRLRVLQQKYEFKLSKFAEDHRWPEALSMLQTMRDRMLDPSEPSRALVVKALSLAGRWIRAFDMLSKLQKWCAARQQAPSSLALSSGVFACKKGAQWRVALVLLAEAEKLEQGLGAQGLAAALRCCAKANVWRRALAASDMADAKGRCSAADACVRAGRAELATPLLQSSGSRWAQKPPALGDSARAAGLFCGFVKVPPPAVDVRLTRFVLEPLRPLLTQAWQHCSAQGRDLEDVTLVGPDRKSVV